MILIDHWRAVLKRSAAIRAQILQAIFGALNFIDPSAALAVWNMMPEAIAERVPPGFVRTVGAVLFVWAVLTILLRVFRQPKLEERTNGQASDS